MAPKSWKTPEPKTDAEKEAEDNALYQTVLESHGGYLVSPIQHLSAQFSLPLLYTSGIIAAIFLILHLVVPVFLMPHLSALITLIIPIQTTLLSLNLEIKKAQGAARDSSQWLGYWVIYAVYEMVRGWIKVYRPGWTGALEVMRSVGLMAVGGPWFARAILVSPPHQTWKLLSG